MEKNKYKNIVDQNTPKENTFYDCLIAFITGGLMGVIAEILIEFYQNLLDIPFKSATVCMLVTLITLSCFKLLQMWPNHSYNWVCSRNSKCCFRIPQRRISYRNRGQHAKTIRSCNYLWCRLKLAFQHY